MTEYEHVRKSFDKGETVDVPDDAVGITTDTFSTFVSVNYLMPVGDGDE